MNTTDILDSYGALHQVITVPTRKAAALEIIMTDLHTQYHAPTTIPPLQVDEGKIGQDSDHNIVVFAPRNNVKYRKCLNKKMIKTRPLPESNIQKYENELARHPWEEIFEGKSVNQKVELFHDFIRGNLDKYFPEKCTKLSNFDKKWMSPELKQLHRSMQREFFKHRKSLKYKEIKSKYKKLKKKSIRSFYTNFVSELKVTDPGRWYSMAKKIGAVKESNDGEIRIESLSNLTNKECAEKIAQHFSEISNEYQPIDYSQLPCYLPAPPPPQVEEYDVYNRINRIRKTKSTLPIDIPDKLRNECAVFLAAPLTLIINSSLSESVYPALWKREWVTPAPKVSNPQNISDMRKISCTSDYSKLYEGYLKEWIMKDISENIDPGQYGGQAGMGTEHMLVCYIDRILKLLDSHPDKSAVIATSLDWASAFDRQDPTLAIKKFIKLGIRPSLIPLLASYLTDRKMQVKFNDEVSELLTLIGGGPQGTLLGGLEYLVQSNDNADNVEPRNRFKYIDDLSVLQLILLSGILTEYNFNQHVASDIGVNQKYLSSELYQTQKALDQITSWTQDNLMKLNEAKCHYMIFTRSKTDFTTRLKVNEQKIDRKSICKLLGVWISEDLSWSQNCQQICKKAYSRLSMLTKLKYAGVSVEDLLNIYILFIRSVAEYCSVLYHSSLTQNEARKLEMIQKTCLQVILGDMYINYTAALEMCGLQSLADRRQQRCLNFALKCVKHTKMGKLFPLNPESSEHNLRQREVFKVNFAHSSRYKNSTIPYCQRLLNNYYRTEDLK